MRYPGKKRVPHHVLEVERDDAIDLLVDRDVGGERLHEGGEDARCDLPKHRGAQPFLRAKVVVQQGLVDAGLLGDLLHARPAVPRRRKTVRAASRMRCSVSPSRSIAFLAVLAIRFN
jgi:hypothetical protein